jgi:chromosomal replication initiation ATPase DnaA
MNGTAKVIETGPILRLLGGKKAYERFVLEGISESHNEAYYAVEDQRFLGEEGFGEELSREAGEKEERKTKKPIETTVKEIAKRLGTTGAELRGKDRRWVVAKKRAEAVTLLVRHYSYRVNEVARYLGREQANVSLMLSRYAERMTRGNH